MKSLAPRSRPPLIRVPAGLLPRLDLAVFERESDGSFALLGQAPAWLEALWPEAAMAPQGLHPGEVFLFLEHFLEEATDAWDGHADTPHTSGPWTETDAQGQAWVLEATALSVENRPLLLLSFPTSDYETVRGILQQSREQSLQYYQLIKEINKREVLLHCIVHDLSTPLAGIKGSLTLMREDDLVHPDGSRLLQIGLNQVEKMQRLIREILSTFASDVKPLLPKLVDAQMAPDAATCIREVIQPMTAVAALKGVQLRLAADPNKAWKVVADATRLERVLFNLIENALRHTHPGTEVVVRLQDTGNQVRISVEDGGEGVPEAQVSSLFEKFAQGDGAAGKAGLGLYFCRITVEDWGGSIGYESTSEGGACFWLRLPRPPDA